MKIGICDSGIGGLTVLKEFIKKYPNNEYLYYGDTINLPYGDKDSQTIFKLAKKMISFFENKKADIIIIACGTISSTCYQELKQFTNIPIYDIVSPTINYVNSLNISKIAVFATNRTIENHIFKNKLNKDVLEISTKEFVPMLETNKINSNIIKNYINKIDGYNVLILGCTHYPLLINEFRKYLDDTIIINMADCLIDKIKINNYGKFKLTLYFTKVESTLIKNIDNILNYPYELIKI